MQIIISKVEQAFFALLRASLWEKEVRLAPYGEIDFSAVLDLAEEQSVVGLLAAGIEHVVDGKPQKKDVLQFIGRTVQLEQRNQAMNYFIGVIVEKMREAGIYTVLVKGQGVAQCYERPLWRACGDVDFFLDDENYERAKGFLKPLAASVEEEYVREKHLGMTIDPWVVELHGRLYSGLSARIERELDAVQRETFEDGKVRIWKDGETGVPLLAVENDVFYVFTHILQHFYKGGIGLRQICDWCRLLYTYRESLDYGLLESRIRRAGLMTAWKAFYALASKYLGLPDLGSGLTDVESATPRHSSSKLGSAHGSTADFMIHDERFDKKADRIMEFVLMSGNFGHNRDHSYFEKYPYLVRKCVSFGRRVGDLARHARIFPIDSLRFFPRIMWNGIRSAIMGE